MPSRASHVPAKWQWLVELASPEQSIEHAAVELISSTVEELDEYIEHVDDE